MARVGERLLDDLVWRGAIGAAVEPQVRAALAGHDDNVVMLFVEFGVALSEVLASASATLQLPVAPPARVTSPDFSGWDTARLREVGAVPLGKRNGRVCLAYGDPDVALRAGELDLPDHDVFLASPWEISRAFAQVPTPEVDEAAPTARSGPAPGPDDVRAGASGFDDDPPTFDGRNLHAMPTQLVGRPAQGVSLQLADATDFGDAPSHNNTFEGDTQLLKDGPLLTSSDASLIETDEAPARKPKHPARPLSAPPVATATIDDDDLPPTVQHALGKGVLSSMPDHLLPETLEHGQMPRPVSGLDGGFSELPTAQASVLPGPPSSASARRQLPGLPHLGVVRVLDRGALSTLYLVEHSSTGRYAVLKSLAAHLAEEPTVVKRFTQGAVAASALKHPHLLAVLEQGLAEGVPYVLLEHAAQGSLVELREAASTLPVAVAVALLGQLLVGLAAAHEAGLVHGDLSPSNILFSRGRVKIGDIGMSKSRLDDTATRTGRFLGSPAYLAPEVIGGDEPSAASDLFSAGVLAIEALTGNNPFKASTAMKTARAISERPTPTLLEREPTAPLLLERVLRGLMAKAPADRYASAAAALDELSPLLDACDPKGDAVDGFLLDPVAAGKRQRRRQADAELAFVEAALDNDHALEAGWRWLRVGALLPKDREVQKRRDAALADLGLATPFSVVGRLGELDRDLGSRPVGELKGAADAFADEGDVLGAVVALRRYLREVPVDGRAQLRLAGILGSDLLLPFSATSGAAATAAFDEPSIARRRKILQRPKF